MPFSAAPRTCEGSWTTLIGAYGATARSASYLLTDDASPRMLPLWFDGE